MAFLFRRRQIYIPLTSARYKVNSCRPTIAKFLFYLGLRRHPALSDLLTLASGSDVRKRETAFKYLLDNHSRYPEYSPDQAKDRAYIPAVSPSGEKIMAKPDEVWTVYLWSARFIMFTIKISKVYVDPDSAIFGFNVIQDTFRDVAVDKLRLKRQPPPHLIVTLLEKNPPKLVEQATKWFEALAGPCDR